LFQVDLSNNGLKDAPAAVFRLRNLRELNLRSVRQECVGEGEHGRE
jgi:hypothetical protein